MMRKDKFKLKAGLTIIEFIMVVAIIIMLMSIGAMSVSAYFRSDYNIRVNQTARTIYLCAQDYLSQCRANGTLADFNKAGIVESRKLNMDIIQNDFQYIDVDDTDEKMEYSLVYSNSLYYMMLPKGDTTNPDAAALREMISNYITDETILNSTILIEYNIKTGGVRSVFYSEKVEEFSYAGATDERENVILREHKELYDKYQGYYGIDYTGVIKKKKTDNSEMTFDYRVVNDDRLTLEWGISTTSGNSPGNPLLNAEADEYKIQIFNLNATTTMDSSNLVMELENIKPANLKGITDLSKVDLLDKGFKVKQKAIKAGEQDAERDIFWGQTTGDAYRFKMIIDCVHHSAFNDFKELQVENYGFKVFARVADGEWIEGNRGVAQSDRGNLYYGNNNFKLASGKVTAELSNGRHLYNAKYGSANADYSLLNNIDWALLEAGDNKARADARTFFNPLKDFRDIMTPTNPLTLGYSGTFAGGNRIISNLEVRVDANPPIGANAPNNQFMGLFGVVTSTTNGTNATEGSINNLTIENIDVDGGSFIGAFAGSNEGNIAACQLIGNSNVLLSNDAQLRRTTDDEYLTGAYLGGIAGYNSGTIGITNLSIGNLTANAPDITGKFVGGFVGFNAGTAALTQNNANITGDLLGGDCVGGVFGYNSNADSLTAIRAFENSKERTIGGNNFVGGYVGFADLAQAVNEIKIEAIQNDAKINGKTGVGGIFGCIDSGFSAAQETIWSTNGFEANQKNKIEPQIILNINNAQNNAEINGGRYLAGIIGGGDSDDKIAINLTNCTNAKAAAINIDATKRDANDKISFAGGIIGRNTSNGTLKDCTNNGTINTCVNDAATNCATNELEYIGGITSINEGIIQSCSNTAQINMPTNGQFGGGITGLSQNTMTGIDTNINACSNSGNISSTHAGDLSNNLGGIAGRNAAKIDGNTASSASVTGNDNVGGIAGDNTTKGTINNGVINLSANTTTLAAVTGNNNIGGIAGINSGELTSGSVTCNVVGIKNVGGIAGDNANGAKISGASSISANGTNANGEQVETTISGNLNVGGIAGINRGTVDGAIQGSLTNSKAFNNINITANAELTPAGPNNAGGIIGNNEGSITNYNNFASVSALQNAGGIAGLNSTKGSIILCSTAIGEGETITPVVSANKNAGGIAGENISEVALEDMVNAINVKGNENVGGIAGINGLAKDARNSAIISKCTNSGNISALVEETKKLNFGGIAGKNANSVAQIKNSLNKGHVQGGSYLSAASAESTGGIAGNNEGKIDDSINSGAVESLDNVAGIAGLNGATGIITTCSTTGDTNDDRNIIDGNDAISQFAADAEHMGSTVVGRTAVGGIAGKNLGIVDNSITKGGAVMGFNNVGGLVGHNSGNKSNLTGYIAATDFDKAGAHANGYIGTSILDDPEDANKGLTRKLGGIIGINDSNSPLKIMQNFYMNATIKAGGRTTKYHVGGIVSETIRGFTVLDCKIGSNITNMTTEGTVSENNSSVGGAVGNNNGGTINNLQFQTNEQTTITGRFNAGGYIGKQDFGRIIDCQNNKNMTIIAGGGSISVSAQNAGGYIGKLVSTSSEDASLTGLINYANVQGRDCVGGIIGFINDSGAQNANLVKTISNMTNRGSIMGIYENDNNGTWVQASVGGIVGQFKNANHIQVQNCTNEGLVRAAKGRSNVGGIAGTTVGFITFEACSNEANKEVDGIQYAGIIGAGIERNIGGISGTLSCHSSDFNNSAKIQNSNNFNIVYGDSRVGGIVGTINGGKSFENRIYKNINKENAKVRGLSSVGGIAGRIEGVYEWRNGTNPPSTPDPNASDIKVPETPKTFAECTNEGAVWFDSSRGSKGEQFGGIIGGIYNCGEIGVWNCSNIAQIGTFDIGTTNDGKGEVKDVGGILGGLDKGATSIPSRNIVLKHCTNEGDIKSINSGDRSNNEANVGGIIGSTNEKISYAAYCTNYARIESDGENVGGIIGRNNGSIVSCKNLKSLSPRPGMSTDMIITGSNIVGGIAGYNNENTAAIVSLTEIGDKLQEEDITINDMHVKSNKTVGGIAGRNNGGLILHAINKGDAILMAPFYSKAGNDANAGGLVGYNTNWGGSQKSAIIDSYSIGNVYSESGFDVDPTQKFIGGLIGQRNTTGGGKFHVQSSYYWKGFPEIIRENLPSIGNETLIEGLKFVNGSYEFIYYADKIAQDDTPKYEEAEINNRKYPVVDPDNNNASRNLTPALLGISPDEFNALNSESALANIKTIMLKFDNEIEPTTIAEIKHTQGYTYKVTWNPSATAATYTLLGEQWDNTTQSAVPDGKKYSFSLNKSVTSQEVTFEEEMVGKWVAFKVKVTGYNGKSIESDIITIEVSKALKTPVMEADATKIIAEMEASDKLNATKLTFNTKITNWDYKENPENTIRVDFMLLIEAAQMQYTEIKLTQSSDPLKKSEFYADLTKLLDADKIPKEWYRIKIYAKGQEGTLEATDWKRSADTADMQLVLEKKYPDPIAP